ncbi:MAG: patatin family protein [Erysipelotrichaceae bacterium]|nr:patatin family protein [Erysipelotrichaceae bacterium]
MKKGLVLEGGALRGLFSAGVLDVMMEQGLIFDGAVGVSAGACFGCNYKSEQKGRAFRYNKRFCKDWRYNSYRSLLLTGDMYGGEFCYHTLPKKLDVFDVETYQNNPMQFYCVATDAVTGHALYHNCANGTDEDLEWIRGSASIPLFARPVFIDGHYLYDGGVSDSIPIRFFQKSGYEKNVVVLTQPETYRKEPQKHLDIVKVGLRKYPKMIERLANRYKEYNETLDYIRQQEQEGDILVVRPKEALNIAPTEHDPKEIERVYQLGREVGQEEIERIKVYLDESE